MLSPPPLNLPLQHIQHEVLCYRKLNLIINDLDEDNHHAGIRELLFKILA